MSVEIFCGQNYKFGTVVLPATWVQSLNIGHRYCTRYT